jgi:uncharacterized protein (DUF305 family)
MTTTRLTRAAALVAMSASAAISVAVRPSEAQETAAASRPPVTAADVGFMSGMIIHHAQAVMMASWAPSHGASSSVREVCHRIAVSQRDEIAFMQRWLADHRQPVPQVDTTTGRVLAGAPGGAGMGMAGMGGPAMMPGMLTGAQMAQLDSARGPAFDHLFLTDMIQHHEGALTMVQQLVSTPGAAQDALVFQFASDVSSGQAAEIDRMRHMLAASVFEAAGR